MLYCEKCGVHITGAPDHCPLCQGTLNGEPDPEGGLFVPLIHQRKKESYVFAIITMMALATIIICLSVDFLVGPGLHWSLFASGGAGCSWVFAVIGWKKRAELAKNIFLQTLLISVVGCLWDLFTGWKGWSLDYVIPGVCVAAVLSLSVLAVVLRLETSEYMAYLCTVAVYGCVPLVFLLTGLVGVRYPSIICAALCFLALAALFLFFRKNTLDELQKKLHI